MLCGCKLVRLDYSTEHPMFSVGCQGHSTISLVLLFSWNQFFYATDTYYTVQQTHNQPTFLCTSTHRGETQINDLRP